MSSQSDDGYWIPKPEFQEMRQNLITLAADPGIKPAYANGVLRALGAIQQLIDGDEPEDLSVSTALTERPTLLNPVLASLKETVISYLTEKGGSAPASEVLTVARAAGFSDNYVKKNRSKFGVRTTKNGFGTDAQWIWALTNQPTD